MDSFRHKFLKNPRVGANPLSVAIFAWSWPTFWKGFRQPLDADDLYEPLKSDKSERLGSRLEAHWRASEARARRKGGRASLLRALAAMFWKQFLAVGLLDAVNSIGLRLVQPLLLGQLLMYFSPGSTMPREHAFAYAAGIVLCILGSLVLANHTLYTCMHLGMQMRIACCSLIFRKATRLSKTALGETASGQVVNLLSNDVSRFDIMAVFLNHLWIDPTLTLVVAYLLYQHVGWAGFVGIGTVFLVVPLQSYTGTLSSKFRHRIALRTDIRVRLMDEVVNGVQVIKMYAWEKPFTRLISEARREEIRQILAVYLVRGVFMTFMMFTTRVAIFSTLITYALSGDALKASMVFTIQSYYSILSMTMGSFFVRGISEVAESAVSIRRLQTFLEFEEFDAQEGQVQQSGGHRNPGFHGHDQPQQQQQQQQQPQPDKAKGVANGTIHASSDGDTGGPVLEFRSMHAKWNRGGSEDTLKNINLSMNAGELVAVIGPVGAGKSSLLQAVLGELATTQGTLAVRGKVSYACQEPWLFAASVRQNITFGSAFERKRYDRVVRACALLPDLAQLPFGDLTLVGERGSSLSGGQRARVNLARAVYREADLYLLDDPLSAVDTHVGKHLFEECVCKLLAGKARVLVTHQVQYLSEVSRIAIVNNGEIQMQGTFKELLHSDVDYAQMLHLAEEDEEAEEEQAATKPEDSRPLMRALRQMSRVSSKVSLERQASRLSSRRSSLRSSMRSSISVSSVGDVELVADHHHQDGDGDDDDAADNKAEAAPAPQRLEATTRGQVKGSLFFRYFLTGTGVLSLGLLILLFLAAQAAASMADYFVGFWTNQEELRQYAEAGHATAEQPLTSTENFVYIYSGIIVSLFVLGFTRSFFFYWVCSRCSQALHDNMFANIIRATMHFFNTNPSGRILNRFSKDLGGVDELLPKALLDATQFILGFFGYIAVAVAVDWMFVVPVAVLLVIFYLTRVVYLKSAKNIKRLEGMTRSPVFTHLNASIQGLSTIRAFNAEDLVRAEFDNHQNLHTSAWFMFIFTSTSFGTVLDLLSMCFTFVVIFSFLLLEQSAFGGDVGLAISQAMAMTGMVQFGMRQSAEVASQLLSVERVLEYADLPTETKVVLTEATTPRADWPSEGRLELKNVWMRYAPQAPPVLKGLNLTINPMEKVGIVGRTGAGKSSLISALFRLAYLEGRVVLDDVETGSVPLQLLRSRISIIPQDPVLFSGTLRKNLDPFDEYKDHQLWAALEDVELRDAAAESDGLEMRVADAGSNFSVGQRQLICLARAILRGNKVLMLDEATANVDPQTDGLIQSTIRSKFARCTVLTVAHRLNTIMDSDRVLVMDAGRAAEFDHPHMLIQKRGIFYSLVQETGHQMADSLARIARENYENKITSLQY